MSVECKAVVMRGYRVPAEDVSALYDNHGVEWDEARGSEHLIPVDEYGSDTCDWVLGSIIEETDDICELNMDSLNSEAFDGLISELPERYKLPVEGEIKNYLICRWY